MRPRVNASEVQTERTRVTGGRSAVFSCPPIEECYPWSAARSVGHRRRGDADKCGRKRGAKCGRKRGASSRNARRSTDLQSVSDFGGGDCRLDPRSAVAAPPWL